jgi:NAD+ kinase
VINVSNKPISQVLLVTHPTRSEAVTAATELCKLFSKQNISVLATTDIAGAKEYKESEHFQLAIVLGGDGTMLRAAQICRGRATPILGVNLGHVGFLAEIDRPTLSEIANSISTGAFTVEERMSLNYQLIRSGNQIESGWALNEVLIERNDHQMIDLFVQIDHRPLSRWWCDSVICATPTGSTAYAYSAGGPVVWPEVDALVLLPLAAHALFSRAMVVSPQSEIVIDLASNSADLNADGIRRTKLQLNDRIILTSAKEDVLLAHIRAATFTDRLVAKFKLPIEGWRGE